MQKNRKKGPTGKNFLFWKLLKNCILNGKLSPQMTTIRAIFFQIQGTFFSIFEKILLNVKETEILRKTDIFKYKQKKFEGDLKIKLCRKRLYLSESVKYLGVKIDTNLNWKYHVNDFSIKLNKANAPLFKMRKFVRLKMLRSNYFAIFDSSLSYCCLVWARNCSTIQQIVI